MIKPYALRIFRYVAWTRALMAVFVAWLLATLIAAGAVLFARHLSGEVIAFLLMSIVCQPVVFALLPRGRSGAPAAALHHKP